MGTPGKLGGSAANPLWIESDEGTPIAAVSGSFEQLMSGHVERRRQAIAHAPDDIRTLLVIIQDLRVRPRAQRRRGSAPSHQEPAALSAA